MIRIFMLVCLGMALAFTAMWISVDHGYATDADCDNPSPMKFGRMGVTAASADFSCRVRVRAVKPEAAPAMKGGMHARSAISLRSRLDRGDRSVFDSPAYVYFDLNPGEAAAWRNGKLRVMVYNSIEERWEDVNSVRLEGGSGGRVRIGSRLSRFGLYALGKTK